MASLITKYFNLICIIFILFGINVIKVKADIKDCENFKKAVAYIGENSFKEKVNKEYLCCSLTNFLKCDKSNQNIVSLELDTIEITDIESAMSFLSNLKHLNTLNLEHTRIDTLPSSIGQLKELTTLKLSYNRIKSIPESIENLINLEKLDLSYNRIDSIPSCLKYLKNLEFLDLSKNSIEGYIPYDLLELDKLREINLQDNKKLKGYVPPFTDLWECNYSDTELCTLKGEKCRASIQCYKEEIEEGNKNNGSPDPNAFVDRGITDPKDRNVKEGNKYGNIIQEILIAVGGIIAIIFWIFCCCFYNPTGYTYTYNSDNECIIS